MATDDAHAADAIQHRLGLLPTERCSLISARYTTQVPGFLFDIPGDADSTVHEDREQRRVSFTYTASSGCVPHDFAPYYVLNISEPWASYVRPTIQRSSRS